MIGEIKWKDRDGDLIRIRKDPDGPGYVTELWLEIDKRWIEDFTVSRAGCSFFVDGLLSTTEKAQETCEFSFKDEEDEYRLVENGLGGLLLEQKVEGSWEPIQGRQAIGIICNATTEDYVKGCESKITYHLPTPEGPGLKTEKCALPECHGGRGHRSDSGLEWERTGSNQSSDLFQSLVILMMLQRTDVMKTMKSDALMNEVNLIRNAVEALLAKPEVR